MTKRQTFEAVTVIYALVLTIAMIVISANWRRQPGQPPMPIGEMIVGVFYLIASYVMGFAEGSDSFLISWREIRSCYRDTRTRAQVQRERVAGENPAEDWADGALAALRSSEQALRGRPAEIIPVETAFDVCDYCELKGHTRRFCAKQLRDRVMEENDTESVSEEVRRLRRGEQRVN